MHGGWGPEISGDLVVCLNIHDNTAVIGEICREIQKTPKDFERTFYYGQQTSHSVILIT